MCILLFQHRKILSKLQKLFLSIMEFRKKEIINMKKQLYHWKRLNDREESIENIVNICLLHSYIIIITFIAYFLWELMLFSNENKSISFFTLH